MLSSGDMDAAQSRIGRAAHTLHSRAINSSLSIIFESESRNVPEMILEFRQKMTYANFLASCEMLKISKVQNTTVTISEQDVTCYLGVIWLSVSCSRPSINSLCVLGIFWEEVGTFLWRFAMPRSQNVENESKKGEFRVRHDVSLMGHGCSQLYCIETCSHHSRCNFQLKLTTEDRKRLIYVTPVLSDDHRLIWNTVQ